ncbi:MAG: AAA family ATPase [Deltaproteobacteria bacterium]|nr:AAA family ATPase [Deltaproteobacteria bacterium]
MHLLKVNVHPEAFPTQEYYPFNLSIFHTPQEITFDSPVTLFVGENGTGKSTLLEALTHRCGIYIWEGMERRRFKYNPYEKMFHRYISVEWAAGPVPGSFFGSNIFRHFGQLLDEWAAADPGLLAYFGGESLMTKSHGQSLMAFFESRYRIKGLYLLDEPETALSPRSQLQLLEILTRTSRENHAQFIIATHSPLLLACPGAEIYSFDDTDIRKIDYEETSHYQIYKDFMVDRKRFLKT